MKTISTSSRNCFRECPFRYFLEYVLKLSPESEPSYYTWGNVIHSVSELLDEKEDATPESVVEELYDRVEANPPQDVDPEVLDGMLRGAVLAAYGHLKAFSKDILRYESIIGETEFELPLPCGVKFVGKIDKIVRDLETNKLALWEIKTAAQTGNSYYRRLPLDAQLRGYMLAARRALGIPVDYIIYDVWKKPQLKKEAAESWADYYERRGMAMFLKSKHYFERSYPYIPDESVNAYFHEIDQIAQEIQWCESQGIWPAHHSGNRRGECQFLRFCIEGGIWQDITSTPTGYHIRKANHPELGKEF